MKRILAGALALAALAPIAAHAQSAGDFYKGRTVQMVVPFSAGGIFDISTRILARHMPRFIPGQPNMVVQNQPGGGGIAAANRLATAVEKDGLTIASVSRGIPQLALVGEPNITFDPLKLTWLGSISSYSDDAYLLTLMANNKINSVEESQKGAVLNLGGVGAGATNTTFAMLARDLLGMKIEVVRGFPGANDIWLAMERGEIDGQVIDISAIKSSRPNFWNEKRVKFLVQFGRATRLPVHAECAHGARTGEERGRSRAARIRRKPVLHGPALRSTARRAGGAHESPARGVHEGDRVAGISRGSQQGRPQRQPHRRGGCAQDRGGSRQNAQAHPRPARRVPAREVGGHI